METATKAFLADTVATMCINSSFSIQKFGLRDIENDKSAGNRGHCKSPIWWCGFTLTIIGVIIHLIAIPYADMTLLAANSSLAILLNIGLSIWLFGEKFIWKYDMPAFILIVGGSLTIVFISNKNQEEYEGQELIDILGSTRAVCFFVFVACWYLLTQWAMGRFEENMRQFETDADLYDHKTRSESGYYDPDAIILPPTPKLV